MAVQMVERQGADVAVLLSMRDIGEELRSIEERGVTLDQWAEGLTAEELELFRESLTALLRDFEEQG